MVRLTVLSVEVLVDTEPWGHPLPEYVVSTMVIWSGEGASLEVACGNGFAAARAGRRRAASFECMLAVLRTEDCRVVVLKWVLGVKIG